LDMTVLLAIVGQLFLCLLFFVIGLLYRKIKGDNALIQENIELKQRIRRLKDREAKWKDFFEGLRR